MAILLKGSDVALAMKEKLTAQVDTLKGKGVLPCLGVIRIGSKPDDISYERSAIKRCESIGVQCRVFSYPVDITSVEFCSEFQRINDDASVHGILLLRPTPRHIDENVLKNMINPVKDIDCMSPVNTARVFSGDDTGFAPCTPEAVLEMLDHYGISAEGKQVVVVGRSMIVGKPLSMLLLKRNATITVCHTKTRNIEEVCRRAEILVAAAGKANMINRAYVSEGCIVIDVGINVNQEGKLCGDVDYEDVLQTVSMITPVPGGVGGVTASVLVKHVIRAASNL